MENSYFIKQECRYFKDSQPCIYHKREGVFCLKCKYFSPVKEKILIIKLDSPGDVLRTTCLLPGLKEKYPQSEISWVTRKESLPLLKNSYIDNLLVVNEPITIAKLIVERFFLAINPSNDKDSASLTSLVKSKYKFGFILNKLGRIHPLNKAAHSYLIMAINDKIKKQNTKTYPEIIYEIADLRYKKQRPIITLGEEKKQFAEQFALHNNIQKEDLVIGLNTGAGRRWKQKKWNIEATADLAVLLAKELKSKNILFGGPEEIQRNRIIMEKAQGFLIDAGCENSLNDFVALMGLVDILITTDSLALHIACALDKKILVLLGPTSASEIELYGKGKKIFAKNMDCLCCYKEDCSLEPNCMDKISSEEALEAVKEILES